MLNPLFRGERGGGVAPWTEIVNILETVLLSVVLNVLETVLLSVDVDKLVSVVLKVLEPVLLSVEVSVLVKEFVFVDVLLSVGSGGHGSHINPPQSRPVSSPFKKLSVQVCSGIGAKTGSKLYWSQPQFISVSFVRLL